MVMHQFMHGSMHGSTSTDLFSVVWPKKSLSQVNRYIAKTRRTIHDCTKKMVPTQQMSVAHEVAHDGVWNDMALFKFCCHLTCKLHRC